MMVTGGFVHRFSHFYLDMSMVDTFAILSFLLLLVGWKQIEKTSKPYIMSVKLINHEEASRHSKIFYWFMFCFLFLGHTAKHWSLQTSGLDVSFVHQAMFHPFGKPFFPSDASGTGTALGEHLLFSLFPVALIAQFFRSDEFLFLIQNLSVSLPLYFLIFRSPLKPQKSVWIWVAVFVIIGNRSLRNALIFDFREDAFAFLGFSLSLMGMMRGRAFLYLAGLLLALLSKENIPFIAPFMAIPLLFGKTTAFQKRTRLFLATTTVLISVAYAAFAFKVLIPYFHPNPSIASPLSFRFGQFGSTPSEMMVNILVHPNNWWLLLKNLINKGTIIYGIMMLLPRFMMFISLDAFAFALPGLVVMTMNMVIGYDNQMAMIFHYDLPALPFLIVGTLIGLKDLIARWDQKLNSNQLNLRAMVLIILALTVSDKWPPFYTTSYFPSFERIHARIALLKLDAHLPVWINERLSAQVNQHDRYLIRDGGCPKEQSKELETFQGYRVIDETKKPEDYCPRPSFEPFFRNSEISIYRYPRG